MACFKATTNKPEFLKICMQTSDAGATYGSVIRAITQQKGIGGLWDGFVPWGMVQAISKGAVFGLVRIFKKNTFVHYIMPLDGE